MRSLMACLLAAALGGATVAEAKNFSEPKAPLSQSKCVKLGGSVLESRDCPTHLCCHIYRNGQLAADLCVK
jgi:hypothetical protein